jgi:hypothetical protein
MPRRSLLVAALLAAALSACGGTTESGPEFAGAEKAVADQVGKLQDAGQAGDAKEICDEVLAKALREQMAAQGSTCQTEIDKALKDSDDFELTVEDVAIDGTTATARVRGRERDGESVKTFEFVREGAGWRATSLG